MCLVRSRSSTLVATDWLVSDRSMIALNKRFTIIGFLFLTSFGCVPLQQQITEREDAELEGFVGPLVVDEEYFYFMASSRVYDRLNVDDELLPTNNNITYESTFEGKLVYIRNCECLDDVKILRDKLIFKHSYYGKASNLESTRLVWNGRHYQNSKGEHIVDLMLYTDQATDIHGIGRLEKKILDVAPVQVKNVNLVWINLVGYDRLIKYTY
jgi:hypothetical protein